MNSRPELGTHGYDNTHQATADQTGGMHHWPGQLKLTWLVLGEDPAARSHRVEQFTAL